MLRKRERERERETERQRETERETDRERESNNSPSYIIFLHFDGFNYDICVAIIQIVSNGNSLLTNGLHSKMKI